MTTFHAINANKYPFFRPATGQTCVVLCCTCRSEDIVKTSSKKSGPSPAKGSSQHQCSSAIKHSATVCRKFSITLLLHHVLNFCLSIRLPNCLPQSLSPFPSTSNTSLSPLPLILGGMSYHSRFSDLVFHPNVHFIALNVCFP